MTAFESLIESKAEDSHERLYFLGQYTSGKAKEIINRCLQRKMEGSYEEAKRLLKRQFGDPFKIANVHITKLSPWPPIRPNSGLALQDFFIALDQAKSAMKGMSHMDDLNTAHVLRHLWEKLPKYLRSKWTERNNKTKSAKGRIADFEEFSQFVREQADLATDPVFSEQCFSKPNHDEKRRNCASAALATSTLQSIARKGKCARRATSSIQRRYTTLMELRNRTTKVTRTNLKIDLKLVAITLSSAT